MEKRERLAGRTIYIGCGYNYPKQGEFVTVYARGKDGEYHSFVAAYSTFQDIKNIHGTRAERLDLLRSLIWSTPFGTELKGICAWILPAHINPGCMHKEAYIDEPA